MKKVLYKVLSIAILLTSTALFAQNVAINSDGSAADASAMLDVKSTDKGFLPPRVELTNTSSFAPLAAHVAGMVVYNTATANDVVPGLYVNNGSGWMAAGASGVPYTGATNNLDLGAYKMTSAGLVASNPATSWGINYNSESRFDIDATNTAMRGPGGTASLWIGTQLWTNASIMPFSNGSLNLGKADQFWNVAYLKAVRDGSETERITVDGTSTAIRSPLGAKSLWVGTSGVWTDASIMPSASSSHNLGSQSQFWQAAYLKEVRDGAEGVRIEIDGTTSTFRAGGANPPAMWLNATGMATNTNFIPQNNNQYLGTSTNLWNKVYTTGIRDGDNSDRIEIDGATITLRAGGATPPALWINNSQMWTNCNISPETSDDPSLGSSTNRWNSVWAANGTIQTSDARLKENILPLSDKYVQFIRNINPVEFDWITNNNGKHMGVTVQQTEQAMTDAGLNAVDYFIL